MLDKFNHDCPNPNECLQRCGLRCPGPCAFRCHENCRKSRTISFKTRQLTFLLIDTVLTTTSVKDEHLQLLATSAFFLAAKVTNNSLNCNHIPSWLSSSSKVKLNMEKLILLLTVRGIIFDHRRRRLLHWWWHLRSRGVNANGDNHFKSTKLEAELPNCRRDLPEAPLGTEILKRTRLWNFYKANRRFHWILHSG